MDEQALFQKLEETNRVNPYTVYELRSLLDSSAPDLSETERLCFSIVTDLFGNKPLAELQNSNDLILWYDYVQLHIYAFLKEKGDYREDKTLLTAGSAILTENFMDELFIRFGIKSELLPLVVSLFVLAAVKISVNAWCDYFYDNRVRENEKMLKALKEMTEK